MKSRPLFARTRYVSGCVLAAALAVAPGLLAQSKRPNPRSKLFVASVAGESQINRGEKIEAMTLQSAYSAEGSIIETKPKATNALVYSNGTGIFFDADTRLEVTKFIQEPFTPNRNDLEIEPSVSQTDALLSRGTIGLCTGRLVAGSSMLYHTALGSVSMQSGKVVIESGDEESRISVLDGQGLVRVGALDLGGQVVNRGEQAIIHRGANRITVQPIPANERSLLDEKVFAACTARKTVFFETRAAEDGAASEIVAVPVVPAELPVKVTVSPASLPR
ncbi:MAG: hypothetical protein JWM88_3359 [Verrucomicrobia bacterium]|nr:hypothetical protein [Verrucomicrobiota bacterium]